MVLKAQKFLGELPALQPEMKRVGCWAKGEKVPKGASVEEECLTGPVNSLCESLTTWLAVFVKTSG